MKHIRVIILIIFCISLSNLIAQGTWKVFTKEKDGLASGSVTKLFEDSKGNIWALTTVWGVMKYDGEKWTNYTKRDGLKSNTISTIFEDSKGNIWLGGFSYKQKRINGIMKYTGDSFEIISKKIGTDKFFEDKSGNIWFGKLLPSSFDGNKVKTYSKKDGYIQSLFADDIYYNKINDSIWIVTRKGLTSYNGTDWIQHSEESGAPTKKFKSLSFDLDGTVWTAAKSGVFSYNNSRWTHHTPEQGMISDDVINLFTDSNNNIWAISGKDASGVFSPLVALAYNALSKSGLLLFQDNVWHAVGEEPGGPASKVTKIFEASNGNLWFDTHNIGFNKYDGTSWESFRKDEGFKANHFQSIFEDSNGNLWFGFGAGGFTGQGLGMYNGKDWTFYSENSGLPSNRVYSTIEDKDGNIWFGTFKGIVKYSPN